jgi:hypothetical protein
MPLYRGSWYSQAPAFGWFDKEDRPGSNALGVPDWQQGIALPSRSTLGQWYNVTPPGGGIPYPLQQTDIGPAKWTGRGVDISAAAGHQMGYTPQNFPTDAEWKIEPRDEPRGLGSPAGMPVQAGDLPDNSPDTAYAGGPSPNRGRKMPTSLMDMFQPTDAGGEPVDFGKALASRSNSLIGLGLGLMRGPGWGQALEGYQTGSSQDAAQNYRQQQLAHQKLQEARQARQDALQASQWKQQFAENQMTEAEKLARASGIAPGTPEHTAFIQKAIQSKTEGDWKVVEIPHPDFPDQKIPVWANARTREYAPFGQGVPPSTGVAANPDVFTRGTAPVYGQGGAGDYAASGAAALPPSGSGIPTPAPAAAPGRAFPPPSPGMNTKTYAEEQTKLAVKQQAAQADKAKRAQMIDPVGQDIERAINAVIANPGRTTGWGGAIMQHVPESKAGDVAGLVATIKGASSLEAMKELRANSPTGSTGLGAVTKDEHKRLEDAIGELDQSRSKEQFLANLDRVRRIRMELIHGPGAGGEPRYLPPAEQRAPSARQTGGGGTGPNADAVRFLKNNPQRRDEFDAKYGEGAAMRYLTGK